MYDVFIGYSNVSDGSCALGDDPLSQKRKNGETNRRALCRRFGLHAQGIVTPIPDWKEKRILEISPLVLSRNTRMSAECIFTKLSDTPIGIHGADCLSVLFTDTPHTVVAAAHVPRSSLTDAFLDTVVSRIQQETKNPIEAYLGPCLQKDNHRIGLAEALSMIGDRSDVKPFMTQDNGPNGSGSVLLDYSAYAEHRLKNLGVSIARNDRIDTYTNPDYFSRREMANRYGDDPRGNLQLAVISLVAKPV